MFLLKLRPEQLKDAIKRNLPALIPAGVVEYHGPHLPIGTDFLIANAICEQVEARTDCVLCPPLTYAPTLSWAARSIEGEMDFDPEPFFQYARELFRHLVQMGFRRIYVLQHHQGPDGLQMLCLKRAAMEVVRAVTAGWGAEWGRLPVAELPIPNIFSLIKIAELDSFSEYPSLLPGKIPVGHGGKGETQLIQAVYPDTVKMDDLDLIDPLPEWLQDSHLANPVEGKYWLEFCIEGWVKELSKLT